MYNRVIKGETIKPAETTTEFTAPFRRIIPESLVRIERHRTSSDGAAPYPKSNQPQQTKPGLQSYMPMSSKLELVRGSASILAINQFVEERVKEFVERFQQEKEQAFADGLKQGEERGFQRAMAKSAEFEKTFEKLALEIGAQKDSLYNQFEKAIRSLAMALAEGVIGEAAAASSEKILDQNLKRCLAAMKGSGRVKIRVNPIDYDFARDNTRILESARDKFNFTIEPDASLAPGGCLLETSSGAVDGRLESQFEILKDIFLQI